MPVDTPTTMGDEVPEALQAVTLKAMGTDRNKRYGSVEAFAGDIEQYQNGFATQAEQAGLAKQLLLLVRRHRTLAAAACVLVFATIGFLWTVTRSERRALASAAAAHSSSVGTYAAVPTAWKGDTAVSAQKPRACTLPFERCLASAKEPRLRLGASYTQSPYSNATPESRHPRYCRPCTTPAEGFTTAW